MSKTRIRRARSSERSVRHAVACLVVVALSAAAMPVGNFVWNGAPYPSADPDTVAQRLKDRSDGVFEGFALPDKYAASAGRVDSGACHHRGLRSVAHVDEGRSDVRSFGLDWSVPDVPEDTARDAQQRVRRWLVRQGWKRTHEDNVSGVTFRRLGFRFEDAESGDQIDVQWNDSTTTLFISVYAPCGQVPDEFVEYGWSEADWHRKESAAGI